MKNCDQSHQCAADVDRSLHDVSPDHRGQAAFECIDERQAVMMAIEATSPVPERDRYHDRNGINTDAFRGRARQ